MPHGLRAALGWAGVLALGFLLGRACIPAETPPEAKTAVGPSAERAEAVSERWSCPMHPHVQAPGPGSCPVCGMDLVPVAQLDAGEPAPEGTRLALSPEAARRAEIRTSRVERRAVPRALELLGRVDYDETRQREITAWAPGRLTRLYVDFTGVEVQRGRPLVRLYSPELIAAQEELIQALRAREALRESAVPSLRRTAESGVEAAREKLRLLGVGQHQILRVERRGAADDEIVIPAPIDGVVVARHGAEGAYVQTGAPLYTLADLSRVWVMLDAYESDLPWLAPGQPVEFSTEALPGKRFEGRIAFIDPVLDPRTRTAAVRVEVDNPDGTLKPSMYVHATAHPPASPSDAPLPLVIPATAPLLTGKRAVVYVALEAADSPTYEGREVVLGPRAGDWYLVESGLREGERVVTHGAFKIDSALQIQARPSMMLPEAETPGASVPRPAPGGHAH